jgi:hypothetical protein
VTKKLIYIAALALPAMLAFGQVKIPDDAPLPPDAAGQKAVIADVRIKGAEYLKTVPDYVCTQISHHSIDLKGYNQWKTLETVSEQLRVVNHQSEYTLIAENGRKASGSEKRPAATVDVSEFFDVMRQVFDPATKSEMGWNNWDSVRGHRVHMIAFGIKKENSLYHIGGPKGPQSGIAGFIYADADTNAVLRIVFAANDTPAKYPIQSSSFDMYYDYARIGDKLYVVPMRADIRHKEGPKQVWNEVDFKEFRKP